MDKYEFNIKVEQLKKLVSKQDYETALKIVGAIDWKRVKNINLLSMVALVYEKNQAYKEAREILLMALERAPVAKRLLYKLSEVSLKEGDVEEAELYYHDFCAEAHDDPRQHLLRYMILRAKGAPAQQLILILESYTNEELDEKWLYELAELYQVVGLEKQCVSICDKIILMFGLGKYVERAMELKQKYAPLTTYQKDLVENRDKYEARLKEVEQNFETSVLPKLPPIEEIPRYEESSPVSELKVEEIGEDLEFQLKETEVEQVLAAQLSKIDLEESSSQDQFEQTRILHDIKAINIHPGTLSEAWQEDVLEEQPLQEAYQESISYIEESNTEVNVDSVFEDQDVEEEASLSAPSNHIMIESETKEEGLSLAIETLKKIHEEANTQNRVIKITGEKLSEKGILNNVNHILGKDLIIEEAASLDKKAILELAQFIDQVENQMTVVLIDTPKRMKKLYVVYPDLSNKFECIGSDTPDVEIKEEMQKPSTPNPVKYQTTSDSSEEMDIDTFAQYACQYATTIDCSVTGKSMLALYERVEIMAEDRIALTKKEAESLIEEAANRAEKPSFIRRIKGMFRSKYDNEGLLILKEEHFIY